MDVQIQRALTLQPTDQQAANGLWARLDREITAQAPIVAMTNRKLVTLLSKRVGNYEVNSQLGLLVDQLWVR